MHLMHVLIYTISVLVAYLIFCRTIDSSLPILYKHVDIMLMHVYLNGFVVMGNDAPLIETFIMKLSKTFALKDLGRLHYLLGVLGD